jgi:hypothetical protein
MGMRPGTGDWKSRAKDLMFRMGVGRKSKPKVADEMSPDQFRAERERRERDKRPGPDGSAEGTR